MGRLSSVLVEIGARLISANGNGKEELYYLRGKKYAYQNDLQNLEGLGISEQKPTETMLSTKINSLLKVYKAVRRIAQGSANFTIYG